MGMTALKLTRRERAKRIELALDAVQAYAKDAEMRAEQGTLDGVREAVAHAEASLQTAKLLIETAPETGVCAECRREDELPCVPYCSAKCEKRAHVRSMEREPREVES